MLQKTWLYVFFGLYPLSIFEMARSEMSTIKHVFVLSMIILIFVGVGYRFEFLNIFTSVLVALFIIAPYVIGKLYHLGIWSSD